MGGSFTVNRSVNRAAEWPDGEQHGILRWVDWMDLEGGRSHGWREAVAFAPRGKLDASRLETVGHRRFHLLCASTIPAKPASGEFLRGRG